MELPLYPFGNQDLRKAPRRAVGVLALCLALAPAALRADDTKVVARAGAVSITQGNVRDFLAGEGAQNRDAFSRDPKQAAQWLGGRVLDLLIVDDAAKNGFDKRPDVERRLARAREALIIELYLDAHVNVPPDYPAAAEARAYYDAHQASFIPPRRYRLAQIFIADSSEASANPKVDEAQRKLKAKGGNFSAIAREMSDARAEAAKGGEIGWLGDPNLAPEIRAAVEKTGKGGVTAPIRMKDGWHIVLVLDKAPAGVKPLQFEAIKETLSAEMRRRKIAAEKQAFVEGVLKANPPTIDEPSLNEALGSAE
jgi:peptidylprolyl isomerase